MQNNTNQQAYDRGVSVFSPEGRLYQVEYAREAVKRGEPGVGIRAKDSIIFASVSNPRSTMVVKESIEKVHKIEDFIGAVSAGYTPDSRRLVDQVRVGTQQEQLRYGNLATVQTISKQVADHLQESTQVGGRRPYGASLIIGGVDETGPRLFEVEPGGTPTEWRAVAEGDNRVSFIQYFEENYEEDLSSNEAIELAIESLTKFTDSEIVAESLDIALVSEEEPFYQLTNEEIEEYMED